MYQKVDFDKLIKGEKYFIRYGKHQWITGKFYKYTYDDYEINAIFENLKKNKGGNWRFKQMKWFMSCKDLYYKIIPDTIYKEKIKDKYDEKVLKIVLKKIVNEDFEWN